MTAHSQRELISQRHFRNLLLHKNHCGHYSEKQVTTTSVLSCEISGVCLILHKVGLLGLRKSTRTDSRKSLSPTSPQTAEIPRSLAGPLHSVRVPCNTHHEVGCRFSSGGAQPPWGEVRSPEDGSRLLSLFFPGGKEGL